MVKLTQQKQIFSKNRSQIVFQHAVMQCPIIGIHKQGCQNLIKLGTYAAHKTLLQEM